MMRQILGKTFQALPLLLSAILFFACTSDIVPATGQ